ncbi:hypothetical protein [Geobacillus sp. 47C-IIb]|uniref:hypothetical protein n=1 Tax=Geobacillus sp. 47C-IIb TaxID=1963026 RepID=UPI001680660E|nr:hypothetical protein [Geobacillus sp. 47C-IIb]QNU30183.1 hypothetical protein IC804_11770 [Geobacillus sp. 47C-IIb]
MTISQAIQNNRHGMSQLNLAFMGMGCLSLRPPAKSPEGKAQGQEPLSLTRIFFNDSSGNDFRITQNLFMLQWKW